MIKIYKNGSITTTVNSAINSPSLGNSPNRSQSQNTNNKFDANINFTNQQRRANYDA